MFLRGSWYVAARAAEVARAPLAGISLSVLLAACATPAEHLNFKRVMDRQVGKKIDDADAYPVFYRLRQLNTKQLPNGREQREYAAGRKGECKLYFEVAPLTGRIERWSFDGSDRDCVIVPPLPD